MLWRISRQELTGVSGLAGLSGLGLARAEPGMTTAAAATRTNSLRIDFLLHRSSFACSQRGPAGEVGHLGRRLISSRRMRRSGFLISALAVALAAAPAPAAGAPGDPTGRIVVLARPGAHAAAAANVAGA